jgi:hypothetical protein
LYGGAVANPINVLAKWLLLHDETTKLPFTILVSMIM